MSHDDTPADRQNEQQAGGTGAQPTGKGTAQRQPDAGGAAASPTVVFNRPAGQAVFKRVVAVFAILAAGMGLFGLLGAEIVGPVYSSGGAEGFGQAVAQAFTVRQVFDALAYAGAPVLAVAAALTGTFEVGQTNQESYLLAFAASAVGHLALVLVGGIFVTMGEPELDFGNALVLGLFLAVGTGLVAAGTVWANKLDAHTGV